MTRSSHETARAKEDEVCGHFTVALVILKQIRCRVVNEGIIIPTEAFRTEESKKSLRRMVEPFPRGTPLGTNLDGHRNLLRRTCCHAERNVRESLWQRYLVPSEWQSLSDDPIPTTTQSRPAIRLSLKEKITNILLCKSLQFRHNREKTKYP